MSEPSLHAHLITLAARWLEAKGHRVIITDMSHGEGETPDAIGWKSRSSTLIECKASRSDFLSDRHKPWRRSPERGMGTHRYYATPPGLIRKEELPPCWGLLEIHNGKLKRIVEATYQKRGATVETSILVSALCRIGHNCPAGIAVRAYNIPSSNDTPRSTLGITPVNPVNNVTKSPTTPWTEPDRSGGGGHTPDEIARANGDRW